MADRYRDYDDRPGDAWRERDERWRARDRDRERPISDRASDEVRSWFGDDEARRRRELDERRDVSNDRSSWRDRAPDPDRGERYSGSDLNRERDFGRSDRYANADEGTNYGNRTWSDRSSLWRTTPERENYRGTSGYETAREPSSSSSSFWNRGDEWRGRSANDDWSGPFVGRGPRGWQRSDERLRDEVCERLTRHGRIDASDVNIRVANGEVTLEGTVPDREAKRLAEDVAESVFGVKDVNNQLKVHRHEMEAVGTTGTNRAIGHTPLGETPRTTESGSVLGLAGTANTPEMTPPDREKDKR